MTAIITKQLWYQYWSARDAWGDFWKYIFCKLIRENIFNSWIDIVVALNRAFHKFLNILKLGFPMAVRPGWSRRIVSREGTRRMKSSYLAKTYGGHKSKEVNQDKISFDKLYVNSRSWICCFLIIITREDYSSGYFVSTDGLDILYYYDLYFAALN